MERKAKITRETKETKITVEIDLDGNGNAEIDTGIGFFDHMLNSFARHGFFDLKVKCDGDLNVDGHHSVEDVGIVLGQAIKEALGDKAGIKRFGECILPMDEACVMCAIDVSGRPYLVYDLKLNAPMVGDFDTELVHEFYYAISYSAGINLNVKQFDGDNSHHIIEASFKAFARALDKAVSFDERIQGVLSTKGAL